MEIKDIISELWEQDKLPIIEGLVKADGSFYEMESRGLSASKHFDAEKKDYREWCSSISVWQSLCHLNTVYYCGEGSYGGEGYLFAMNNNEVKWLFFYSSANPFEKLWIENDEIHVLNNNKVEWIFPIEKPEQMRTHK